MGEGSAGWKGVGRCRECGKRGRRTASAQRNNTPPPTPPCFGEARRRRLEQEGAYAAGGGAESLHTMLFARPGRVPAVTAGGMLISSRLGSTMSSGRSTVSSLVRNACNRSGIHECKQQKRRGRDRCRMQRRLPAPLHVNVLPLPTQSLPHSSSMHPRHPPRLPAGWESSSGGCGCTAPAAP